MLVTFVIFKNPLLPNSSEAPSSHSLIDMLHPTGFACTQFKLTLSENEKLEREFNLSPIFDSWRVGNFDPNKLRVETQSFGKTLREIGEEA